MIYISLFLVVFALATGIIYSITSYNEFLNAYEEYDNEFTYANLTGLEFAKLAISKLGLKTRVVIVKKKLSECYIPSKDEVHISEYTANKNSLSSITVVAHELGHAIQNKNGSKLLTVEAIISNLSRISLIFLPFEVIFGIVFLFFQNLLIYSIILFAIVFISIILSFVLKVAMIPVEREASNLAIDFLTKYHFISGEEIQKSRMLLRKALGTYVGGVFAPIAKFLKSVLKSFS